MKTKKCIVETKNNQCETNVGKYLNPLLVMLTSWNESQIDVSSCSKTRKWSRSRIIGNIRKVLIEETSEPDGKLLQVIFFSWFPACDHYLNDCAELFYVRSGLQVLTSFFVSQHVLFYIFCSELFFRWLEIMTDINYSI